MVDGDLGYGAGVARQLDIALSSGNVLSQLRGGFVNLLDLPKYGRYQHTYEEMLAAHEPLIESAKDRVTLLQLGRSLAEESHTLYLSLATSPVPLQFAGQHLVGVGREAGVIGGDATGARLRGCHGSIVPCVPPVFQSDAAPIDSEMEW